MVPLVYSTYSGSFAPTDTQAAGSAPATASFQSMSRPFCSSPASCGRWRRITLSGLCLEIEIALSTIGLYGTVRPGSSPHEPQTISLGRACSMRAASSCAAKPPKTTECTAPMRAQASMAINACGTIGM